MAKSDLDAVWQIDSKIILDGSDTIGHGNLVE